MTGLPLFLCTTAMLLVFFMYHAIAFVMIRDFFKWNSRGMAWLGIGVIVALDLLIVAIILAGKGAFK
jgi:hypothetical protein